MSQIPLGQQTAYPKQYSPQILFPVARQEKRQELGISQLPFEGKDCWTAYELSWLNEKGKPQVGIAEFVFDAQSPNIIESKSLKLYLNSLNQQRFASVEEYENLVKTDLTKACGEEVEVHLLLPKQFESFKLSPMSGTCIDQLDIEVQDYDYDAGLLKVESDKIVSETLHSDLLKSNCLITGQPDWASVLIRYSGQKIDHASLLRYLISFRNHNEFHEQCVERIFCDICSQCAPEKLTVYARYTRRGGLDINPFRSNFENFQRGPRLARQ